MCYCSQFKEVTTIHRIQVSTTTGVSWVHDVITCADFMTIAYGVWAWWGVKFWPSPLTCVVALTTLWHYRASV